MTDRYDLAKLRRLQRQRDSLAARGNAIVDGLGMLLHQARPGFEKWFGVVPEVDADLRQVVLGPSA